MKDAILEIRDLNLSFGGLKVVDNVSLKLFPGEFLGMVGPNGSGKTCVLNMINSIYKPDSGEIVFDGAVITDCPTHEVSRLGIGRAFQLVELFPHMTVLENLLLGCHTRMKGNILTCGLFFNLAQKEEISFRRRVEEVLDFLELGLYRNKVVTNLPFGIQKMVGLGRALAGDPKILLLDEPSAGMVREEKERLARFLLRIKYELEIPVMWVEHDVKLVTDLCDRLAVLSYGRLLADGSPEEVINNPEVVRTYFGSGD